MNKRIEKIQNRRLNQDVRLVIKLNKVRDKSPSVKKTRGKKHEIITLKSNDQEYKYYWDITCNEYHRWTPKKRYLYQDIWQITRKREIPTGWQIHHLDGNHSNNDLYNLKCMPKSLHDIFDIDAKKDIEYTRKLTPREIKAIKKITR